MPQNKNWIEEQEEALGFDAGTDYDAEDRLLEIDSTNRDISERQGRLFSVSRFLSESTGFAIYKNLPDELEKVQANVDKSARADFMKVAIERFQGKLANATSARMKALMG